MLGGAELADPAAPRENAIRYDTARVRITAEDRRKFDRPLFERQQTTFPECCRAYHKMKPTSVSICSGYIG